MKSPKSRLFGLILSTLSILLTFLLLEAGLRIVYLVDRKQGGNLQERLMRSNAKPVRTDVETDFGDIVRASSFPGVVYELKPGLDCLFRSKRVITNSQGLRDREYNPKKADGTFRIVGLGDSVMFGWGVEQSESYLETLERSLNARPQPHPLYEVINFAVPGYNTAIEAATFEHKALPFDPDLVVIQFVNNDFGVPSFMLAPPAPMKWGKSYAGEFVAARLGLLKRSYTDENLVFSRFRNVDEEERSKVLSEYSYMLGPDGYRRAMGRLGRLAKERGIPVIVMTGTIQSDQSAVVLETAKRWGFELLDIGPVTTRVFERKGYPTTPEDIRRLLWVSKGDHHPNSFGHAIYAEGLEQKIEAMGVLSRKVTAEKGSAAGTP